MLTKTISASSVAVNFDESLEAYYCRNKNINVIKSRESVLIVMHDIRILGNITMILLTAECMDCT